MKRHPDSFFAPDPVEAVHIHLKTCYPDLDLTAFGNAEVDFLDWLAGDNMPRVMEHIVDHDKNVIVWSQNTELLGYTFQDWQFEVYLSCIPYGYHHLQKRYAHGYAVYFRHRMNRYGLDLFFEKEIPLQDASGVIHLTTQQSWIFVSEPNTSLPILTATRFIPGSTWDISQPYIPVRPRIFVKNDRKTRYEDILIRESTSGLLEEEMGLSPFQIALLQGHARGLSNADIARELGAPVTKVNFHNTLILGVFHAEFSKDFPSAAACAKFLVRIGVL